MKVRERLQAERGGASRCRRPSVRALYVPGNHAAGGLSGSWPGAPREELTRTGRAGALPRDLARLNWLVSTTRRASPAATAISSPGRLSFRAGLGSAIADRSRRGRCHGIRGTMRGPSLKTAPRLHHARPRGRTSTCENMSALTSRARDRVLSDAKIEGLFVVLSSGQHRDHASS